MDGQGLLRPECAADSIVCRCPANDGNMNSARLPDCDPTLIDERLVVPKCASLTEDTYLTIRTRFVVNVLIGGLDRLLAAEQPPIAA